MFCPGCGVEEKQPIQFCRTCGSSFRPATDAVTSSAISAREEIGRAMAEKIREFSSAKDLKKIAEDVLPEIEKFLETPAEKKLRRYRKGTIVMFIGMGAVIFLTLVAIAAKKEEFLFLAGMGGICFFIGLAIMVNGYFLSVVREKKDVSANTIDGLGLDPSTADLSLPAAEPPVVPFRSVTEGTTTHLGEKIRR